MNRLAFDSLATGEKLATLDKGKFLNDPMARDVPSSQRYQFLLDRARRYLAPRRVLHLVGVTHTTIALAVNHHLDIENAALVGLLHDQSKEMQPKDILTDLKRLGQALNEEDRHYPNTWHGFHAAVFAKIILGIRDPDVIEAISLHTTADAGISSLTKALFIADLCEPTRNIKMAAAILFTAQQDLDEGFRQALTHKLRHIVNKKKMTIHPRAVRALQAYLQMEPAALIQTSEIDKI